VSRRLKAWSLAGGATLTVGLVALLSLVLTRTDRTVDRAAASAQHETHQNGRIAAHETWQREHEELTRPLVERFLRVERKQDAMLIWMRLVSKIEGWPMPPEPASLPMPRDPGPGLYAAETDRPMPGGCP
jgi:hypothetical protein